MHPSSPTHLDSFDTPPQSLQAASHAPVGNARPRTRGWDPHDV